LASLARRSIGATGCLTQPCCNLIVNLADVSDLAVMHPMLRTEADHLLERTSTPPISSTMERDPALAEVRALQRSGMIHYGQAEYLRAWQRFEQLERLAAHRVDWAAWAAGHHHHRLFALLPRQATVLEAIELAQQSLRHLVGVDPHPTRVLPPDAANAGVR
jgi:hypothetical protein